MATASNAAPLVLVASDRLRLTADGKIIDFLDPNVARANAPEEHVRQNYARKLHYDYGYAKDHLVINAPIGVGLNKTIFADVGVYDSARSAATRDQAKLRIVVETKAPDKKSGIAQLKSYIFASSAEGGVWVNQTTRRTTFDASAKGWRSGRTSRGNARTGTRLENTRSSTCASLTTSSRRSSAVTTRSTR